MFKATFLPAGSHTLFEDGLNFVYLLAIVHQV